MRQPIVRMNDQLMISNYHNVRTFSELGSSERKLKNIASRKKAWMERNVEVKGLQNVLSMVRAYLWSSLLFGKSLGRNRAFMLPMTIWILVFGVVQHKGGRGSPSGSPGPRAERRPKDGYKYTYGSLGLPKERDLYGNRVRIVRKSVFFSKDWQPSFSFFFRYYAAEPNFTKNPKREKVIKKMRDLTKRVLKDPSRAIDRKLYDLVCNPFMLEFAYNNIKRGARAGAPKAPGTGTQRADPGGRGRRRRPGPRPPSGSLLPTKGIIPKTLDGISWNIFLELAKELKEEKFQFKPKKGSKRIGARWAPPIPFTIPPSRDKIVLEVIRMILNVIFEPSFLDCSHGYRPGRGLHSVFYYLKTRAPFAPGVRVIEGNKCFLKIDHSILMNIIEKKIKDRQFTKLIWKSLGAGYIGGAGSPGALSRPDFPQGSIIGPILNNIYLHKLDEYILKLMVSFDIEKGARGERGSVGSPLAPPRSFFLYKKPGGLAGGARPNAKKKKEGGGRDPLGPPPRALAARPAGPGDPTDPLGAPGFYYKRISYVRSDDDWIIIVKGSYPETVEILSKVLGFCRDVLKLKVNKEKTKIKSLQKGKVVFLGINVFRSKHVKFSRKRGPLGPRFSVNLDRIKKKLREINILKGEKPVPRLSWGSYGSSQILSLFNSVLKGYLDHYSPVCNFSRFKFWLKWVITTSAGMTLARKYNTSTNKIFGRGRLLRAPLLPLPRKIPPPKEKGKKKISNTRGARAPRKPNYILKENVSITSFENLSCPGRSRCPYGAGSGGNPSDSAP
uniref:ORF781 n=1 Tax=Hoilungia sp. H24 TaxID=2781606 RepID=A0A7U3RUP3_9METZ|nr:ORF781 [Hoilungia sp. H24]